MLLPEPGRHDVPVEVEEEVETATCASARAGTGPVEVEEEKESVETSGEMVEDGRGRERLVESGRIHG